MNILGTRSLMGLYIQIKKARGSNILHTYHRDFWRIPARCWSSGQIVFRWTSEYSTMVFFGCSDRGGHIDQMYTIVFFSPCKVRCEDQRRCIGVLGNFPNLNFSRRISDISTTIQIYRLVLFELMWKHRKFLWLLCWYLLNRNRQI